jgi:nicotinamide-nucleotide amidase
MPASLRAWIVSQGEELLTGQTLDTNAHFLAGQLTDLGLRVLGASTAGDRIDAIATALRDALGQADVVVCTGGLGPTADDLTADALASVFGVPVVEHAEALAQVVARYEAAGRRMAEANRRQAMLPEGCDVLANPVGTAPGFALGGRPRVFCLPGVPHEMRRMWALHVRPWVLSQFDREPPQRHLFRVLGKGESQLQDLLGDVPERFPGVELGFRTKMPENQVKLVAEPGVDAFAAAVDEVRSRLGRDRFAEDEAVELAAATAELLLARGESLALAESCTGGLVAHLCVTEAGSSRWFERGWVTYSNAAKVDELGVPEATLQAHGAVSEETAAAMARGAVERSGAHWAVSITGIAGPAGGTADKPVGTVCFAVVGPDVERTRTLHIPARSRDLVRRFSAFAALDLLRRQLLRLA